MAHPVGERHHCDNCGAEIVYVKACSCPSADPRKHSMVCCGQEMKLIQAPRPTDVGQAPAPH